MENQIGESYHARKALFARGIAQGRLTVREIDEALPAGTMTASERWLLFYCLRASEVEIYDEESGVLDSGRLPIDRAEQSTSPH